MYSIGIGTALTSQGVPISQVVLKTGFTVHVPDIYDFLFQDMSVSPELQMRIKQLTDSRDILIMYSSGSPQQSKVTNDHAID